MAGPIRPEVAVEIGRRIRSLRTEHGWTVEALALNSGISRRMLTQIELGQANPSIGTLDRVAAALGTTFAGLAGVGGPTPPPTGVAVWSTCEGSWGSLLSASRLGETTIEVWRWHLVRGDVQESSPEPDAADAIVHVLRGKLSVERDVAKGYDVPLMHIGAEESARVTREGPYRSRAHDGPVDAIWVVPVRVLS